MQKPNLLSLLWIVLVVNFIFCDVFTLMYSEDLKQILTGRVGDIVMDQQFLLSFAIVMEIPMMMILLSRILKHKLNRVLNLIFGTLLIVVQTGSLFAGENTMHYIFFSVVEIGILAAIIHSAWKWREGE